MIWIFEDMFEFWIWVMSSVCIVYIGENPLIMSLVFQQNPDDFNSGQWKKSIKMDERKELAISLAWCCQD